MNLSILVPAYNEARTLESVMRKLNETHADAQIVYIDDGSKDGTSDIMHAHARSQDIVLTKENGGKGSAIRLGLEHATGQFTVIQDADLEYEPEQIHTLVREAMDHPGCAVFGSRFLQPNPNVYKRFLLGNKLVTAWLNILYGSKVTDSYTCYKLLPTDVFRSLHLTARGFELEAEICAKCLKKGIQIRELPIAYHPRTIEEGKKINGKDAWKAVTTMWRLKWTKD